MWASSASFAFREDALERLAPSQLASEPPLASEALLASDGEAIDSLSRANPLWGMARNRQKPRARRAGRHSWPQKK